MVLLVQLNWSSDKRAAIDSLPSQSATLADYSCPRAPTTPDFRSIALNGEAAAAAAAEITTNEPRRPTGANQMDCSLVVRLVIMMADELLSPEQRPKLGLRPRQTPTP